VADQNDLLVWDPAYDGRDVLAVVAHGPIGAVLSRGAVTGQIDRNHGVLRLQGIDLRVPIVGVGGPAVYEDNCGIAFAINAVLNVHTVGFSGELW